MSPKIHRSYLGTKFRATSACFVVVGAIAVPLAATAGGKTHSPTASAAASSYVKQAAAHLKKLTTPSKVWKGPRSAPKLQPGKTIVYVDGDASNAPDALWGTELQKVGKKIGWTVKLIDGQGTVAGWQAATQQAISLHPAAIVTSTDGPTMASEFAKAAKLHIPIIGLHLTAGPGAYPQYHVYWNIGGRPQDVGAALADYIIVHSHGLGRAIILYDHQYAVATQKADAMKKEYAKCKTCKLLLFDSLPLAQEQTLMPQTMTSWLQKYPKPFYVMSCCDVYFDYAVVPLESTHTPYGAVRLLGMDGTPSAYNRIRTGKYEVATVPEPEGEEAYMAVDEINRALHGMKPSTYVPPTYVVTKANVKKAGGPSSQYDPEYPYAKEYLKIWGVTK